MKRDARLGDEEGNEALEQCKSSIHCASQLPSS